MPSPNTIVPTWRKETLAVPGGIPGSDVTIMKGLGHLAVSESPAEFSK